jgi:hypothetical protein
VPVFGKHKSPIVCVATVGLNPSATEFLDNADNWMPSTERLSLVIDFDVQERESLSNDNLNFAANLRASYFERNPHAWFNALQGLLSAVNVDWNYAKGSAVHVDIVACGTRRPWSELGKPETEILINNCHKHLKRTLTELPKETLLFLDGRTVKETLVTKFGFGEQSEENIGEAEILALWQGTLQIENRLFKYIGWSKPVDKIQNCVFLAHAVADALLEIWCRKGQDYHFGNNVPQNHAEAAKWFRKAAERGHENAQCWMGICYDRCYGLPQDFAEAAKWFQKAASQGNAFSQSQLGSLYQLGRGLIQDSTQAAIWYRKAAEQEDVLGQCELGFCYEHGLGVNLDYAEALKWYSKAAQQGNKEAADRLNKLSAKLSRPE